MAKLKDSDGTRKKGKRGGPQPGSGRPSKFSQDIADRVVLMVRAGNYLETAASASGISPVTLRAWLRDGRRAGRGAMFDFAEKVERAQAESEAMDVNKLLQHGQKDWRALAWRLERRFPDHWREAKALELSGPEGGPIQSSVTRYELHVPHNPLVSDEPADD